MYANIGVPAFIKFTFVRGVVAPSGEIIVLVEFAFSRALIRTANTPVLLTDGLYLAAGAYAVYQSNVHHIYSTPTHFRALRERCATFIWLFIYLFTFNIPRYWEGRKKEGGGRARRRNIMRMPTRNTTATFYLPFENYTWKISHKILCAIDGNVGREHLKSLFTWLSSAGA